MSFRTTLVNCCCLLLMPFLAGCTQEVYRVELRPDGDRIHRSLSVWTHVVSDETRVAALSDDEARKLEELYESSRLDEESDLRIFEGDFESVMPQDIGGWGRYHRWTSPLGDAYFYSERFRGSDDLQSALAERERAAHGLVDHFRDWIESAIDDPQVAKPIARWIDTEFRSDLQNAVLYSWSCISAATLTTSDTQDWDLPVHLTQFLMSRDYLRIDEIPEWSRAIAIEDHKHVCRIVCRVVARKVGIKSSDSTQNSLRWLSDPEKVLASLRRYIRNTDEYERYLARWREVHESEDDLQPSPEEMLGEKIVIAFLSNLFGGAVVVDVELSTRSTPFLTNGVWNAQKSTVSWSQSLDRSPLPTIVYAAWCEPNEKEQRKRFGFVALDGKELSKYINWYRGLTAVEAARWDAMTERLHPSTDPQRVLQDFRFEAHPRLDMGLKQKLIDSIIRHRNEQESRADDARP